MKRCLAAVVALALVVIRPAPFAQQAAGPSLDRDLPEITIGGLESLYAAHRYTVTQVTEWYLDRIARYNDRYKAILHVDRTGALATAAREDAAAVSDGQHFEPPPLWGVPLSLIHI